MQISLIPKQKIYYTRQNLTTPKHSQINFGQSNKPIPPKGNGLLKFALATSGLLIAAGILGKKYMAKIEQSKMFNPDKTKIREIPKRFKDIMQVVTTRTRDGLSLQHYYIPAQDGKKTVIFCHGVTHNATSFFDAANFLHKNGYGAFLLEYRGFAKNPGKPSEKGLYKDFNSAVEHLNKQGIKDKDIVLWGFSMGGGVATEAAKTNRFGGLILNNTFTSMKEATKHTWNQKPPKNKLAKRILQALPSGLIPLNSKFENKSKISKITTDTLILHAKDDERVPFDMAEKLAKSNPNARLFISEKGGHTHIKWTEKEILGFLGGLK